MFNEELSVIVVKKNLKIIIDLFEKFLEVVPRYSVQNFKPVTIEYANLISQYPCMQVPTEKNDKFTRQRY